MSIDLMIKFIYAFVIGLTLMAVIYRNQESESDPHRPESIRQRYLPYVSAVMLPCIFAALLLLASFQFGPRYALPRIFSLIFVIFLHISLYYMLLLPFLPLLRRTISARVCALLWTLPNLLYIQFSFVRVQKPAWVISVPGNLIWILSALWIAGFTAVFLHALLSHLLFRRKILKDSQAVTDPAVLEILDRETRDANFQKRKFKLVRSPQVPAPLSIGLFRSSTRIVLPEKSFSPEEYALIFRHELIHIGREDAWAKFFLLFSTAVCWFNPFLWIARKKCSEDLELSCDETVLQGTGDRQRYAELILKAAGDDRGFTTCLSSAASTMRYRLREITRAEKKRSGIFTAALIFFILFMSCGYVGLAFGEHRGSEAIFPETDPSLFSLDSIRVEGGKYYPKRDSIDAAALNSYLSDLELQDIAYSSFSDEEKFIEFQYTSPDGLQFVRLYDSYLEISSMDRKEIYYLPEPTDWETLNALIPEIPAAEIKLLAEDKRSEYSLTPTVTRLVRVSDGREQILRDWELQKEEVTGIIYGSDPRLREIFISFSLPLQSEIEVFIQPQDQESGYWVTPQEEDGTWRFSPSAASAVYTIRADFSGKDGAAYQTEFTFSIEVN